MAIQHSFRTIATTIDECPADKIGLRTDGDAVAFGMSKIPGGMIRKGR